MIAPAANDNLPPVCGWLHDGEALTVRVAALLSYLDSGETWLSLVRVLSGPDAGKIITVPSASVLCSV